MDDIVSEIAPGAWMVAMSNMLRLPHRRPRPFTLGEAVLEMNGWARTANASAWRNRRNTESLRADVEHAARCLGPRVRDRYSARIQLILESPDREVIRDVTSSFLADWGSPESVSAAFRDLCAQVALGDALSRECRARAAIIFSQLGDRAAELGSPLSEVSAHLTASSDSRWWGRGAESNDVSPGSRLRAAERALSARAPVGEVVVWLAYRRASVRFRQEFGAITFFDAGEAIANAGRGTAWDYPEQDEVRALAASWLRLEEVKREYSVGNTHLALARVALGHRSVAGACEAAERLVAATLSIAVISGGVAWQPTGHAAVVTDGRIGVQSLGSLAQPRVHEDAYGIQGTAQLLAHASDQLQDAMLSSQLPSELIDALLSIREASMTDHRDVLFHAERAVSPRVATALEEQAIELIAAFGKVEWNRLADELERTEVEYQFDQQMLRMLLAPLQPTDDDLKREGRELLNSITRWDETTRVLRFEDIYAQRRTILRLPMTGQERSDFRHAIRVLENAAAEAEELSRIDSEVALLRTRQRRVRNAVSHGNPLTEAALVSIREYTARSAHRALSLGLGVFGSGRTLDDIIASYALERDEASARRGRGQSLIQWLTVEAARYDQ